MIGSLGDVVFEVSSDKVRTFDEMERSASVKLATHELHGGKPLVEFVAPGGENISFAMNFDVSDGIDPTEEVKKLRKIRDTGEAVSFILGGEPQGDGKWLIESLSERHRRVDNRGAPHRIDCSVVIIEYIPTKRR